MVKKQAIRISINELKKLTKELEKEAKQLKKELNKIPNKDFEKINGERKWLIPIKNKEGLSDTWELE